jgi:DNA repair protein RecN (Recombination protein N)
MISTISISNYALIDKLEIDFSSGLSIITGETGAGKSILLGALALLVGQRADSAVLQDKTRKCIVEARFDVRGRGMEDYFKLHDMEFEEVCTIRREISVEGKSRAFVNDSPVTLNILKDLGEQLIDIHSQHQTLTLNNSNFQLTVLDAYARNEEPLRDYKAEYKTYRKLEQHLLSLREKEIASKRDQDYFQFQYAELEEARLGGLNLEALESELSVLNHSEEIKSGLTKASGVLAAGDQNLLAALGEIKTGVSSLSKYDTAISQLAERINSTYIELKDISDELDSMEAKVAYDPGRVAELTRVLDSVYKLFQKHQVKTIAELLQLQDSLSERLTGILSLDAEISKAEIELKAKRVILQKKAATLTSRRTEASPKIEKELLLILSQLGMANAVLKVSHAQLPNGTLDSTGQDAISFLFSANKGSEPRELNKVASGGELSRLMLSIKSLVAKKTRLPSVVFDEIDTGVSGDIADKVGSIMESMSSTMQVIAITHLPQIASKGDTHFFVYKETGKSMTYTRIRKLENEERVMEIAKMLSTGQPTQAALKNAKELLSLE